MNDIDSVPSIIFLKIKKKSLQGMGGMGANPMASATSPIMSSGSPMMGPRMMGGATSPVNPMAGGFARPPAPPQQQPSKPSDPFADLGEA